MKQARRNLQSADTYTIKRKSSDYPAALEKINDPPELLYAKGRLPAGHGIAVVGSRECTPYGRRMAYRLATEIAAAGFAVVSGLARGVDAAAHRGALDGNGLTVAVLPSGIDRVYPPRHEKLAARIAKSGAVVTEFKPGTWVHAGSFHRRNRIIAGLAVAVVVVEAAHRSGAKITANFALQYNREVLAVPGPVGSPTSDGANFLLAEGAAVCTGIDSLLQQLPLPLQNRAAARLDEARNVASVGVEGLDPAARAVLEAMPKGAICSVEQLAAATELRPGSLLAALTQIEVRGLIRSLGAQRYERV
jgi:DNA processing protein